nr:MAG TPA: nucelotide kinase [Caudoviricetes sp.]
MDNKTERDEILELVEEMMKEFGLTETNLRDSTPKNCESSKQETSSKMEQGQLNLRNLRNPINGQIEEADEVHKPNHYNWRGTECKDVIRQLLGSEGYKRYCEGNVIKYLYRYTRKGTPATDIAKAAEYLRMIAEEEAREQK